MDDEERYSQYSGSDFATNDDDEPSMEALPDPDDAVRDLEGLPGVCFFCQDDGPMWTFEVLDPGGRGMIIHLCEVDAARVKTVLGISFDVRSEDGPDHDDQDQ